MEPIDKSKTVNKLRAKTPHPLSKFFHKNMNKKFLQSVTAGILGLTLATSCAKLGLKKESHSCNSNSCASKKKEEGNKCSSKEAKKDSAKKESNKCSSKKAKKAEVKTEAKSEEKKQ